MKSILSLTLVALLLCAACKESPKTVASSDTMSNKEVTELASSEIRIIPISHATAVLEWEELTIYIDPVGGADAFKDQRQPDLILITDVHGDHLSVETLKGLMTEKAKIIAPQAVADKIPTNFTPQIDVLNNGDSKERFGISVEAIPMYNLRKEALKFHEKGRGNGYVITIDGKRLYFSGDTEDIPEMRALKNIDMAFVCMNLPYTMTVESAADAVLAFQPKQVYPYHYRGRPEISDVAAFKRIVEAGNKQIEVVQLNWYPTNSN